MTLFDITLLKRWIIMGAICGLGATAIYPLLLLVGFPLVITVILAAALGILLSLGSIGLFFFLGVFRKTVTIYLAVLFNIIGGTIFNLMILVQLTVRNYMSAYLKESTNEYSREIISQIWRGVDKVQLGLDVAWDVYICTGTILFAFNMFKHPRFGKIFAIAGLIIATFLLGLNIYSFPVPPDEAGLIDLGPLLGLWYAAVAIRTLLSLDWLDEQLKI
ncbi:MAG: hypothetical protein KAT07_11920 [Calditrichia bacterium]|nr:hypothetical protein [Calditrichia bacterium]